MDLIIHDAKLKKVAYIDNELQDTLSFYDDKWSRYLETASSTFEFTVYKNGIKSDTVKEKAYRTLTERSFVSFKYNKRTYLFNVMRTEETETTIRCYCENLNLELLNEMAGPYKAKTEMSFVEYCNTFFLLIGGAITIGHNEIEDRERTLEWTGTDTKLKRLLSIANQFDAEIEFETILDEDSSLKSFILNVYKENDDKNQGVGKVREDIVLRIGHNIEGVKRTIDKTGIFNMITPVGKATVDVKVTKANPKYVAPKLNAVTYSGGSLSNGGRTISKSLVNEILNLCVQHKLLPSGVFSQLYLESFWGNSPVARADNNWGGLTWAGSTTRPSGIKVTQGTARPANEGGYYMHFASVSDYMKDYTYLLAEQGIYKVKGANNIDAYTKGLFRFGGAAYDYAAAGYGHYAPLMRSIRGGINSASNGAMDTLDNQFKTAGTVGTAPVSQIATKTKDALAQLGAIKGQHVGSGQCYALSALYSLKLGGAGLGGGVTGFRGLIGAGAAASHIGEDYNWSQFGWKVVRPSEVKHLIPGSIANIRANAGGPVYTGGWGHTVVIKGLSGDTLTVLEQNYAGHQFVEEHTYSASAYLRVIQTLCYPPEIVQGKRIDGTESAPVQSGTPGNNEPKTISETQQQEKTVGIPKDLYREWKNEEGVVEFYLKNGSIYAPISKELYPSAFSGEEISDNWIRKNVEYETIDVEKLISYSLQDIRKNCYPSISYEVKGTDENLDMGDTVTIDDKEFPDGLVLTARVSEQHISFTNDSTNQTIFDNYKALKNKLSKDLIDRYEELAEQAKPYELRLLTDKGTQFKNSTGLSVLTAELWKSNKQYDATFQFRNFDTLLASGLTYTVDGSTVPIDKPFLISVDAFIGNDLVATRQITFTNVSDGTDGIGIKSSSVMHGISTSATVQPTNWTEAMPVAKQGEYLWKRKITDYTDPSKPDTIELTYSYQGKNGSAGTSVSVTKIEYQVGTSGTTAPTSTWINGLPVVPDGQFLWMKVTFSDGNIATIPGKQGATGPKGDKGDTYYPHTAWANSADGTDGFTTIYPNLNLLEGSKDFSGDWWAHENWENDGTYKGLTVKKKVGSWGGITKQFTAPKDGIYTFSAYIKSSGDSANVQRLVSLNDKQLGDKLRQIGNNFDWLSDSFQMTLKAGDRIYTQYNATGTGVLWTAGHKWEEGSIATPYMPSSSEVTTADWPSYIGQYTDFTQADSTNPSDYTWSLMRGNDGKNGISITNTVTTNALATSGTTAPTSGWSATMPTLIKGQFLWTKIELTLSDSTTKTSYSVTYIPNDGINGQTPVVHTAYANSQNGAVDFSLTDSTNRRFIGQYVDYNSTNSTDPTMYKWINMVGSVDFGGTNVYALSGNINIGTSRYITDFNMDSTTGNIHFVATGNDPYFGAVSEHPYVYSAFFGIKIPVIAGKDIAVTISDPRITKNYVSYFTNDGKSVKPYKYYNVKKFIIPKSDLAGVDFVTFRFGAGNSNVQVGDVFDTKIQVEYGNVYSDWSPAFKDIQSSIDSKADQLLTQQQILVLEEKTTLERENAIAEAMQNTISEVEQKWQLWYDTNTKDEKQQVANDIASLMQRTAELDYKLGEASAKFSFINNETIIGEDGVAIGDKAGKAKLFMSGDSISFLTNGVAQMTLTGDTLSIKNGLFTERIQIGNFVEEVYDKNPLFNVVRAIKNS